MTLEQLVENLQRALGDGLKSAVLYGSVVKELQTKHFSDINVLIVVADMNVQTIRAIKPVIKEWTADGNPPPLVFSQEFIDGSRDVFPLDFLDIRSARRVLYGPNPIDSLEISATHLRHQVEFELRSKLIQLQQKFLQLDDREDSLRELLGRSRSSFTAIFRGVERLVEEELSVEKRQNLLDAGRQVPIDWDVLEAIFLLRKGTKHSRLELEDLFSRLYEMVEALIQFVDQMKTFS